MDIIRGISMGYASFFVLAWEIIGGMGALEGRVGVGCFIVCL